MVKFLEDSRLLLNGVNKSIKGSLITTNIFRMQTYDSVMFGYFCIGFIDLMLKGKIITDFTNLYSPNNFKKMILFKSTATF